jgi:hypothetical protein
MMAKKSNTSRNLELDKKRSETTVDFERTSVKRPETPVQTYCEECKAKVIVNDQPLFETQAPVAGLYIPKITKACETGCPKYNKDRKPTGKGPRAIDLVPVDATIRFMSQLNYKRLCKSQK